MPSPPPSSQVPPRRLRGAIWAMSLGTMLNPINSTMITVALVAIAEDFALTPANATWVITVFYLVSCAGQPILGRFADRFGPRRIFCLGMLVFVAGAVWAATTGSFVHLCLARAVMAIGTSCAYPSAINLLSRHIPAGPQSVRALAIIQFMNTFGAALGPALGGVTLFFFGWQAQFLLCVPLALLALVGTWLLAPADPPARGESVKAAVVEADVPGIVLFAVGISGIILALLRSLPGWSVPVGVVGVAALAGFVLREQRATAPFINVRALAENRSLLLILLQFATFNAVFYLIMIGLPQYLEVVGDYSPPVVGALMVIFAGMSLVALVPGTRALSRVGLQPFMWAGLAVTGLALAAMAWIAADASLAPVVVGLAVAGVAYGLIPLAMNQGMYASARPGETGVAAGLFQLSRYFGAVIATVIAGVAFGDSIGAESWGEITIAMTVLTAVGGILVLAWKAPRL